MFQIFEHPWGLLITAAVATLILLIIRAVLPDKRRWWQWLLPLLIAVAAFGLDYLVQTDTEKIKALMKIAATAVEEENPDAIEPLISPYYRDSFHPSKQRLMSYCRTTLSRPLIEEGIMRMGKIEFSSPATTATAIFTVRIRFDQQSYIYDFKREMFVKVKLDLQKEPDSRWLIRRSEIIAVDLQPTGWKDIKQASW
ncbi:MAG: hypothetical protein ACYS1A_04920 [Planctomycetota bacterium]|jgi:hypothetical protein